MPTVRLQIIVEVDGVPVRNFPLTISQTVDEWQEFDYEEPGDNNDTTFSVLPVQEVDTVQLLVLSAVNAVGVRLEGGEAGNVALRLGANGGVVVWNVALADTNLTVNVNSISAARLRGIGGGT